MLHSIFFASALLIWPERAFSFHPSSLDKRWAPTRRTKIAWPLDHCRSTTSMMATAVAATDGRTSPKEVVSMFDDFASYFEERLIDDLEYSAPRDVANAAKERIYGKQVGNETTVGAREGRLYASAIDAGCGTGLIGPYLREIVDGPVVGVDLSPKMAEKAAELIPDDGPRAMSKNRMRRCDEVARQAQNLPRLYDGVFTGDLMDLDKAKFVEGYGHTLEKFPTKPVDLIVCTDVLCYFGDMKDILQVFADRLAVGGDLVFTTETLKQGDYNWVELLDSERFAQNPDYVHRMAVEAGLTRVSQLAFTPRLECGEKVLGTLHTFTKEQ